MARRYVGSALLVLVAIVLLLRFGSNGLPFEVTDVSCIRFQYALLDSEQIVVRNPAQVASIMDNLQVKPGGDDCIYDSFVVFTIHEDEHLALISQHSFNIQGKYNMQFQMPSAFYAVMQAYRDSAHLTEPWDNRRIFYDKHQQEWLIKSE